MAEISVNSQYEYSVGILGNFSGGSINVGGPTNGVAPHPVAVSTSTGLTGNTVTDLSAIALGGFNGLNN
jgi:hypothetical protein